MDCIHIRPVWMDEKCGDRICFDPLRGIPSKDLVGNFRRWALPHFLLWVSNPRGDPYTHCTSSWRIYGFEHQGRQVSKSLYNWGVAMEHVMRAATPHSLVTTSPCLRSSPLLHPKHQNSQASQQETKTSYFIIQCGIFSFLMWWCDIWTNRSHHNAICSFL